jgi:hypothetical protein
VTQNAILCTDKEANDEGLVLGSKERECIMSKSQAWHVRKYNKRELILYNQKYHFSVSVSRRGSNHSLGDFVRFPLAQVQHGHVHSCRLSRCLAAFVLGIFEQFALVLEVGVEPGVAVFLQPK